MKHDQFYEFEEMYRSYQSLKIKLYLLQPKNVQTFTQTPVYHDQHSKVEAIAIERLELEHKVKLVQACLDIMTRDERLFIEYRYFQGRDMEMAAILMNWSRRETFRLRQSVLTKTKWFLSLENLDCNRSNAC